MAAVTSTYPTPPSPFPVLGYLRGEDADSRASPIAEQSYVSLGAQDVAIKPCAPGQAPPQTLAQFRGHTRLELARMTEGQARAEMSRHPAQGLDSLLEDFVRKETGYGDCAVRVFGKLHRKGGLKSKIEAIVLVASSPTRRNFILRYLQYVVSPESVMREELRRDAQAAAAAKAASAAASSKPATAEPPQSLRRTPGGSHAAHPSAISPSPSSPAASTNVRAAVHANTASLSDPSLQHPFCNSSVTPSHSRLPLVGEHAHNALDSAIHASNLANWSGTTVAGIAGALDVIDKLAAGITLVGPAIQVVSLGLRFGSMVIAARQGEEKLQLAGQVLCRAARDVADALLSLAHPVEGEDLYGDLFEKVLDVMGEVWSLRAQVEHHLLLSRPKATFKAELVVPILDGVGRVHDKMLPILIASRQSHGRATSAIAIAELRNDSKVVAEALSSEIERLQDEVREVGQEVKEVGQEVKEVGQEVKHFEARVLNLETGFEQFKPNFITVPNLPNSTLEKACKQADLLADAVLGHGRVAVCSAAVVGDGGVGKTTGCILICHKQKVKEAYKRGGIYFMVLGPHVTDSNVVASVATIVFRSGGVGTAARIKSHPQDVAYAVSEARAWFEGKAVLLVVDNVWPRRGSGAGCREWVPLLSQIVSDAGSGFLFSTRMSSLAHSSCCTNTIHFDRLPMDRDGLKAAADIVLSRAGMKEVDLTPGQRVVLDEILRLCGGWQLVLTMAGARLGQQKCYAPRGQQNRYRLGVSWDVSLEKIRRKLDQAAGGVVGAEGAPEKGLQAVMAENLEFVEQLSEQNPSSDMFEDLDVDAVCQRFGAGWAGEIYATLAAFDAPRSPLVSVLAMVWGLEEEQAQAVAGVFVDMGLANFSMQDGDAGSDALLRLELHDLQYDHAANRMCGAQGSYPTIAQQHQAVLVACADAIGQTDEVVAFAKPLCSGGPEGRAKSAGVDWSLLFHGDQSESKVYFQKNITKHLVGAVGCSLRKDPGTRVPHPEERWRSCIMAVLTDFRWLRESAAARGMPVMMMDRLEIMEREKGTFTSLLTRGEKVAFVRIIETLQQIDSNVFTGDKHCEMHGAFDRGLASELYSRLKSLTFADIGAECDRQDALHVQSDLLASIADHARGGWLRAMVAAHNSVEAKPRYCVCEFTAGHAVAFLPRAIGRFAVSGGEEDGVLLLHDLGRGGVVRGELRGHGKAVTGLDVSESGGIGGGAVVASCSLDGSVRFWDAARAAKGWNGTENALLHVLRAPEGELGSLRSVAVSADARCVAAGEWELNRVHLWMCNDGASCGAESAPQDAPPLHRSDLAPDMQAPDVGAASSSSTTSCQHFALGGHTGHVNHVAVSQDGTLVVSASDDGTARLWCVQRAEGAPCAAPSLLHVFDAQEATGNYYEPLYSVAISRDKSTMLTGSSSSGVLLWQVGGGRCIGAMGDGSDGRERVASVESIAVLESDEPDGGAPKLRAVTGHNDGLVRIWDADARKLTVTLGTNDWSRGVLTVCWREFEGKAVGGAGVGGGGPRCEVVAGHEDGSVRLWEVETGREGVVDGSAADGGIGPSVSTGLTEDSGDEAKCAAWSRDGSLVAVGMQSGIVIVRRAVDGSRVWKSIESHFLWVVCVDFSDDAKLLASGASDDKIRLWNAATGDCQRVFNGHRNWVGSVIFSFDGRRLISGDFSGGIRLWEVESGDCLCVLRETPEKYDGGTQIVYLAVASGTQRQPVSPLPAQLGTRGDEVIFTANELGVCCAWSASTAELLASKKRGRSSLQRLRKLFEPDFPRPCWRETGEKSFLVGGGAEVRVRFDTSLRNLTAAVQPQHQVDDVPGWRNPGDAVCSCQWNCRFDTFVCGCNAFCQSAEAGDKLLISVVFDDSRTGRLEVMNWKEMRSQGAAGGNRTGL